MIKGKGRKKRKENRKRRKFMGVRLYDVSSSTDKQPGRLAWQLS